MTLAGILSGLTNPCGTAFALSRAAARIEPVRPVNPHRAERTEAANAPACTCGQTPCVCGGSRLGTQDRVELSPAALGDCELTPEEQQRVEALKRRDAEVREHEAAHLAAAGPYARGAQYEYETGPDGKRYVTGGEVQIDTAPVPDDPEATSRKMETVQRAALAPKDPSAQDLRVAADAAAETSRARAELARLEQEPARDQEPRAVDSPGVTGSSGRSNRAVSSQHSASGGYAPSPAYAEPQLIDVRA